MARRKDRRLSYIPALIACALTASCAEGDGTASSAPIMAAAEVEFTGPRGSGEPNLFATPEGDALLSWLEPVDDERHALRLAIRRGGVWSEPRTIHQSQRFFVNWADFPSAIALESGAIAAHWLEKVAPDPYAYHVRLSISHDEGATWSDPITAHRDDSPTEHGFVSMVPWNDGAALVWLDGRAMHQPAASEDASADPTDSDARSGQSGAARAPHEPMGDMSLRFTTVAPDGTLGPEVLLDDRTCECCQTALARAADGLVAAYRNRSPDEIRDIGLVRGAGELWSAPIQVADDGWKIPGCPVNGPQIAAAGERVAVAWFTGEGRTPRVNCAFSDDGGASFSEPIRVDEGRPAGRVDIERLDDGSVIVVWLEASDPGPRILARRVGAGGELGPALVVAETSGSRSAGFPRIARSGSELLVAWTAPGEDGGVRVRSVRLASE